MSDAYDIPVRPGGNGRPWWNRESSQFMYAPVFHFTGVPGKRSYRFTLTDVNGAEHVFTADDPCACLAPVWSSIPEGKTVLRVEALNADGSVYALCGARAFHRLAPFDHSLPKKDRSYRESAVKALLYILEHRSVRHWIDHGTPDPSYDLNVYPSKMIYAVITAMLTLARLCPDKKEEALTAATRAADYLMSITPDAGPLAFLPPTYQLDFCPDPVSYGIMTSNWQAANRQAGYVMMIYPPHVGSAYLDLENATGKKRYLDAAVMIGEYYRDNAEECGSWCLLRDVRTGERKGQNLISPMERAVPFLMQLYGRTRDASFKAAADRAVSFALNTRLPEFNWEGQFEDVRPSSDYRNLTHYEPGAIARYFAEHCPDDEKRMAQAEELMRFAEDQFVVWKKPSRAQVNGYDTSIWHTPAGLEQYGWYVPIDASTAYIAMGFLALYRAGRGDIWLDKARALADQLVLMQDEDGMIPTHWMHTQDALDNFWLNCMTEAATTLAGFAAYEP